MDPVEQLVSKAQFSFRRLWFCTALTLRVDRMIWMRDDACTQILSSSCKIEYLRVQGTSKPSKPTLPGSSTFKITGLNKPKFVRLESSTDHFLVTISARQARKIIPDRILGLNASVTTISPQAARGKQGVKQRPGSRYLSVIGKPTPAAQFYPLV